MSYHIFTYNLNYIESNYEIFDNTFLSSTKNICLSNSNHPKASINIYTSTNNIFQSQSENLSFNPWQPSKKLFNLYKKFEDTILYQYPYILCSYCSKLMYSIKARWTIYNSDFIYSLQELFSDIFLTILSK